MTAGERMPRTVNPVRGAETTGEDSDDGELLDQVRDVAERMLAGDDRSASALRVRVGHVSLEMEWPEPGTPEPGSAPAMAAVGQAVAAGQAAAGERPDDAEGEPGAGYLTAHTVGCFYRRPSPDAAPFVGEGDVVSAGQQVAIIEAMKLMLPVEADRDCRIGSVLVGDGETVEYGDRLFALEPVDDRDDR